MIYIHTKTSSNFKFVILFYVNYDPIKIFFFNENSRSKHKNSYYFPVFCRSQALWDAWILTY